MGKVAEYKNNYLVPIVEYFEFENKLCIVTEYETGINKYLNNLNTSIMVLDIYIYI